MKFVSTEAQWTKGQIAQEVNDMDFGDTITERMITDVMAQEFVNTYYEWLQQSVSRSEEASLQAEAYWQEQWYIKVMSEWFTQDIMVLRTTE
jgi:hypothetical protein